jgi:hypothetical protein
VNIRTRGKTRPTLRNGRRFWYSIAFSVIKEVPYVLYITTDADPFIVLPSSLLDSHKERMYPDNKSSTGVFDINWDDSTLKLRNGFEGVYCYSLKEKEDIQKLQRVFGGSG